MSLLSSRMALLLGAVLVLGSINAAIWQKQQTLSHGQLILLKLAPVDPRSLMQGDYMILRYDLAEQLAEQLTQQLAEQSDLPEKILPPKGQLLIEQDAQQVVNHAQLYRGQPLQPQQHLLNYRQRNGQLWLGAESFFFQEGHADHYQPARYAGLRVAANGQSVLVSLYDAEQQEIKPPPANRLR